jgi:hypothetical protein
MMADLPKAFKEWMASPEKCKTMSEEGRRALRLELSCFYLWFHLEEFF